MKDIIIVGHGGCGTDVTWLIERINIEKPTWNILGYIDSGNEENIIGNDDYLLHFDRCVSVAIAIANPEIRYRLYQKFSQNSKLSFPNLIDPSVLMMDSTARELGEGNMLFANTVYVLNSRLGSFNMVYINSVVGHDSVLHDFVTLSPSVNISGKVCLESMCEVGTGAQILQGRRLATGARIGAGAVVVSDMPENCTAVGVPAKIIKYRGGQSEKNIDHSRGGRQS